METKRKARPEDMQLEAERSIREIVIDEIHATNLDNFQHGEPVARLNDKAILNDLIAKVYGHIEAQALEVYKSNEPWALKAWAYSNILKDVVSSEANQHMVEELMSPIVEWQDKQPFNPIAYYRERLAVRRKKPSTIESYVQTAAKFVARVGRKKHYSDEDVDAYQRYAHKRYQNTNTYYQECQKLMQFLRNLPDADKQRELPMGLPEPAEEFYQPTFTDEDIETLAWAAVIDNIPANLVVRLIIASIYGARRGELTNLSNDDFNLDGDNSTIFIRTEKKGQRKPQPIPQSLVPLFNVAITPLHRHTLHRQLHKICKRAGVSLPKGAGYHCFRRRVATAVSEVEHSDTVVSNFMRWAKPRSMLSRYKQTPVEQTDRAILEKHPFVKLWEEIVPYLLELNSSYSSLLHNAYSGTLPTPSLVPSSLRNQIEVSNSACSP